MCNNLISRLIIPVCVLGWLSTAGCHLREPSDAVVDDRSALHARIRTIEYPNVATDETMDTHDTPQPLSLSGQAPPVRELALEEAIQLALANSTVLRDMGGMVLQSPQSLSVSMTPAMAEMDPRIGVEAALSAFDAQIAAGAFFENNDRAFNNRVSGLGTQQFQQNLHTYNMELRKRAATGTIFNLRGKFDYDFNNSPFNNNSVAGEQNLPWTMKLEGEFRQPLLQGAGVDFNRIAGPNASPGYYNGVLLARLNTDVSLADFEAGVTQLVSNVENAYWELYLAFRILDAKIAARNLAYQTWQQVDVLAKRGAGGPLEATSESLAREQLLRLEADVQNALVGRTVEKSNANVFREPSGVYYAERRLRRAMGIPAADGMLLRPSDEPAPAQTVFAWDEVLHEALDRRVELRRQKWMIKRRELELTAARNFLLPRVDAVGLYRFRGLGHDLINSDPAPFGSALGNLTSGDYQEWMMGVEMAAPVGYRQGHAAVRHAQLSLARERAVLKEQEHEVVNDLASAVVEMDRAFILAKTNYNRRLATIYQLETLEQLLKEPDAAEKPRLLDLQLDSQRRLVDAEIQYYSALCEHAVALKNVFQQKGALLEYNRIYLTEGGWPARAYQDAARREHLSHVLPHLDRHSRSGPLVSDGPYSQEQAGTLPAESSLEQLPLTPPSPADARAPRQPEVVSPPGGASARERVPTVSRLPRVGAPNPARVARLPGEGAQSEEEGFPDPDA